MNPDAIAGARFLGGIVGRAAATPDAVALRFVQDLSGTEQVLTWRDLAQAAWTAREQLRQRNLKPGDRVLLPLPTGRPYVAALLGALWAGLVPTTVPVSAAAGGTAARELDEIAAAFAPNAVIGAAGARWPAARFIAAEELEQGGASPPVADFSLLQPTAYVQFTSGSTGRPRGLALSWRGIGANVDAIVETTGMAPGQRSLSWLPMYHDMGIFGGLFSVLQAGCEHVLADPAVFTANPLVWLRLLDRHRAVITVAPPSALRACIDLVERRPRLELDLSHVDQIICGAEPVPPGLPRRMGEVLGPYGLRSNALRPVYGLAEATLAVSFTPRGRGPRVDAVARERFEDDGAAAPAGNHSGAALEWVSAGPPLPGIQVCVTGDDGSKLPERQTGRIRVLSPSLYTALLEDGAFLSRDGEWLDTGDLGYVADGELYVTGRAKDLIIKGGRNYAPDRIENAAGLAIGVRRCAAFGVFDPGKLTERVVLMVEGRSARTGTPAARDRLRLDVRAAVRSRGLPVDEVFLVARGTLPLTTSGKVRRQECRRLYLQARGEEPAPGSSSPDIP